MTSLREIRCPDCKHLLFKAAGDFDIEILCDSQKCRRSQDRVKRLIYPHPLSISPSVAKAQTQPQELSAIERPIQMMRHNDGR